MDYKYLAEVLVENEPELFMKYRQRRREDTPPYQLDRRKPFMPNGMKTKPKEGSRQ